LVLQPYDLQLKFEDKHGTLEFDICGKYDRNRWLMKPIFSFKMCVLTLLMLGMHAKNALDDIFLFMP